MIRRSAMLLVACAAAAVPLIRPAPAAVPATSANWPAAFEGRRLVPIAPAPEDARLASGFPGAIARFSDGRRQLVLRRVGKATRQLHPARDCYKALGYQIAPLPVRTTAAGFQSCFTARRGGVALSVCEQIMDARGRSFVDVSSWYWPALLGTSEGPWLAVTAVERVG